MTGRAVVVPPVPGLLPEHAGLTDPLSELRAACDAAVAELVDGLVDGQVDGAGLVVVLHDPLGPDDRARGVPEAVGARVARSLLHRAGWAGETRYATPDDVATPAALPSGAAVLVLASGSARRHEKAPGHLDERSFTFDDALGRALATGDPAALTALDADLADELLAAGVRCLHALAGLRGRLGTLPEDPRDGAAGREGVEDPGPRAPGVRWAGDPYGVQYWVAVLGPGVPAVD